MIVELLLVVIAYLLGTFPTALLVGRASGHDPAAEGSQNPGASNVYRLAGARAGLLVFAGDLAKGALAAGLGYVVDGRPLAAACGLAAVAGHMFPVTRRFRGGRGVATAAGMTIVLFPLLSPILAVAWFAIARTTGKASLASLLLAVAVPVTVALLGRPGWEVAVMAVLALAVIARHAPNLRRLAHGQETSLRGEP